MIVAVLDHVVAHALRRAEELDVAQVVDLVGADRAVAEVPEVPRDVGRGGGEERDAGSGVGDLRRRREHDRAVRVAGRRGQGEDVGALGLLLGEVVQRVGVVPEDLEVGGGGRHRGEPGGHVLADDGARRVGVRRHDPHALDARVVGDEGGHGVGVGAVVVHRHGDHLDAEALEQREVAVVAGHRAHEA